MKRLPRYSLRTLFIVLTLLTLVGGRELHRQSRQARAVQMLRLNPNTYVDFDYDLKAPQLPEWAGKLGGIRSTLAELVRRKSGSDFFNPVVRLLLDFDPQRSADLEPIEWLPHLQWLQLAPGGTGPLAGSPCPSLASVTNCRKLEYLVLGNWLILRPGPSGSPGWNGWGVALSPLNVNASNLAEIRQIKSLRVLAIGGPGLTDKTVDDLAKLSQLEFLYLSHTEISADGFSRLRKLLPKTTIVDMSEASRDYAAEVGSKF